MLFLHVDLDIIAIYVENAIKQLYVEVNIGNG